METLPLPMAPGLLKRFIEDRVNKSLNSLVTAYRDQRLTGDQALYTLAGISELRALLADVERQAHPTP